MRATNNLFILFFKTSLGCLYENVRAKSVFLLLGLCKKTERFFVCKALIITPPFYRKAKSILCVGGVK